jgi:hypothetical protein
MLYALCMVYNTTGTITEDHLQYGWASRRGGALILGMTDWVQLALNNV